MSKLRIWLKNYIYTEDPSFSDDFKHLDLIYQSCFYDIFDLKLFKSWWKNIILVFNTVFMIWVTLSCMFSLNLFMDDIERFVSCIFTFMVAAQTGVRMWALLYFKEGFRAIRNKITDDELEDGMEMEVSIYYKRIYRKVYISVVLSYLASTSKILLALMSSSLRTDRKSKIKEIKFSAQ